MCVWNRERETICGGKTEIVCKGKTEGDCLSMEKRKTDCVCMETKGKRDRVCVCKIGDFACMENGDCVCMEKRGIVCVYVLCVLDTFCAGVYNVHFHFLSI